MVRAPDGTILSWRRSSEGNFSGRKSLQCHICNFARSIENLSPVCIVSRTFPKTSILNCGSHSPDACRNPTVGGPWVATSSLRICPPVGSHTKTWALQSPGCLIWPSHVLFGHLATLKGKKQNQFNLGKADAAPQTTPEWKCTRGLSQVPPGPLASHRWPGESCRGYHLRSFCLLSLTGFWSGFQ